MRHKMKQWGALLCAGICLAGLCSCGGSAVPPNDPLYPEQSNLAVTHIEEAWRAGLTGRGVTIGIIDSGAAGHEDLDMRRISGKSYVDEDASSFIDTRGHGTYIAGLLAATRNNQKGIAGMTDSDIRVYKVIGEQPHIGADHVAQAIRDAADDGCDVINISMGTSNENTKLQEAVEYALSQNVIVVAAAGGDSETPYYPAAYDGVIGVDAVSESLEPMETMADNESVDVTAPGEGIVGLNLRNGYDREGAGASYAAVQVTAMAAMAKQERPEMNAQEFLELLKTSVEDKGETGYDTTYGWGAADFGRMTEAIKGNVL